MPEEPEHKLTVKKLYPDLTPEQQEQAEYLLKQYTELIRRIADRIDLESSKDKE